MEPGQQIRSSSDYVVTYLRYDEDADEDVIRVQYVGPWGGGDVELYVAPGAADPPLSDGDVEELLGANGYDRYTNPLRGYRGGKPRKAPRRVRLKTPVKKRLTAATRRGLLEYLLEERYWSVGALGMAREKKRYAALTDEALVKKFERGMDPDPEAPEYLKACEELGRTPIGYHFSRGGKRKKRPRRQRFPYAPARSGYEPRRGPAHEGKLRAWDNLTLADIGRMSREEALDWLSWNDPNGSYHDGDAVAEGFEPLTTLEAHRMLWAAVKEEREPGGGGKARKLPLPRGWRVLRGPEGYMVMGPGGHPRVVGPYDDERAARLEARRLVIERGRGRAATRQGKRLVTKVERSVGQLAAALNKLTRR